MTKFANTIIMLLLCSPSHATVIWDEAINGDIRIGQNIGALQLGTNTFKGTFSLMRSDGGGVYADTETGILELANNLQIISMNADITSTSGYGVLGYKRFAGLHAPSVSNIYLEEMFEDSIYSNLLPFNEAGTYTLFSGGGSASVEKEFEFYWDWEINIEVTAVPEPATIILFGLGFAIIAFSTKRKKRGKSCNQAFYSHKRPDSLGRIAEI